MREKLDKLFNMMTFPQDKLSHFFWGFIYFHIFIFFVSPAMGIMLVLGMSILKEVIDDKYRNSPFDIFDIFFTCLPGILYYLTLYYIY